MLATFDVDFDNIFGATTDAAGDARLLIINSAGALWEWCPPHNLARIMKHAFGARNIELQVEIAAMKGTIKSLRDHTKQ